MSRFDHPNIVALVGVITRVPPCRVVLQLCTGGSLQSVLRKTAAARGTQAGPQHISGVAVLCIARDVAAGMAYLEEKRHVHRDLATRNVLVHDNGSCLIADFGLSRRLGRGEEHYAIREGVQMPLRWSAPEVVHGARYTSAADVWSFFVTMWEVWSEGQRPFGPMMDMRSR